MKKKNHNVLGGKLGFFKGGLTFGKNSQMIPSFFYLAPYQLCVVDALPGTK